MCNELKDTTMLYKVELTRYLLVMLIQVQKLKHMRVQEFVHKDFFLQCYRCGLTKLSPDTSVHC